MQIFIKLGNVDQAREQFFATTHDYFGFLPSLGVPPLFNDPPNFSHEPFGANFHSSGMLSALAFPAQVCRAVPQSFIPFLAMP